MREYRDWRWHGPVRGRIWRRNAGEPWQAEYYAERGQRKRRSTYTQDEAQAWLALAGYCAEASLRDSGHRRFTVADAALSAGTAQTVKGVSKAWRERCIGIIEDYLFPILGADLDLNGPGIAKAVQGYVQARRGMLTPAGTPTKHATIRKELLIIHQGARWDRDHGDGNYAGQLGHIVPMWLEQLVKVEAAQSDIGYAVTFEQYLALLEVATEWRRPWIMFARNTGIDIGPAHRVRKDGIDWSIGNYGAVPVLTDTKTIYRPRMVPLNADSRAAVDMRMSEPGEYLFEPMWSSQAFKVCMERWCPKAKIPRRIRWKDLSRHSLVSELGNVGAPKNHTNVLIGESGQSMMVEKVYQHIDPNALAATMAMIPTATGSSRVCQDTSTPAAKTQDKPGTLELAECKKTLENAG